MRRGEAYQSKGKDAEKHAMMVAVAEEHTEKLEKKMKVTDKVAKDAACLSKKAMACSSKAMAAVKKVAASEATTKTEVEELRKRQEVLERKQETECGAMRGEIDGMKEVLEKRWANDVTVNDAMAVATQAMAAVHSLPLPLCLPWMRGVQAFLTGEQSLSEMEPLFPH